jgi:hypothetical protein
MTAGSAAAAATTTPCTLVISAHLLSLISNLPSLRRLLFDPKMGGGGADGSSEKSGSLYQTTRHYSQKATIFTVTPVGASFQENFYIKDQNIFRDNTWLK